MFHTVGLSTWTAARSAFDALGSQWLFRGQEDPAWSLSTTLERLGRSWYWLAPHILEEREEAFLWEFHARAHGQIFDAPDKDATLEWLSLLVQILIDGKTVEAPAGSTILDAAKCEGIHIPVLCYSPLLRPLENCRLCVVAVAGENQYKAACSTVVKEGMDITTNNDELFQTRKLLLELLLDTHYGDCVAPCTATYPANVDIQGYLGYIRKGEYEEAVKCIKKNIPMPLTIGRVSRVSLL